MRDYKLRDTIIDLDNVASIGPVTWAYQWHFVVGFKYGIPECVISGGDSPDKPKHLVDARQHLIEAWTGAPK